jgi:hypothetical protein
LKERADQRAHELHQQKMSHAQQLHEHTMAQGQLGMVATAHAHDTKMELAQQAAKKKPKGDN